jgi:nucleoside-diphosphate-sugar epimerase
VDNYFTSRKDNIADLLGNKNFEAFRHDVTFPLYVEVDEIYNLACPASPIHYQFDLVQTTKTSVIGAINMVGLAKRVGAKILQSSTSEVYGDPTVHPQTEDYRGERQPARPPRLLRQRQALRRDPVLRLPPTAQGADQRGTHRSTPTTPACTPTTAGWSPTSSSRP